MKSTLVALVSLVSVSAFAEVRPNGAVTPFLCGSTATFPSASTICVASVQGSRNQYLSLQSYTAMGPLSGRQTDEQYFLIKSVATARNGAKVYKASGVIQGEGRYPIEYNYELTVNANGAASLKANGESFFGADAISMEPVFHTL